MLDDIFESCERSAGDLAGVFEWDGEVGYFYLYAPDDERSTKIKGAIKIVAEQPDFDAEDVAIRWDSSEACVGLFIREVLWGAFIVTGPGAVHEQVGGGYRSGETPEIPKEVRERFA